ncbi:phosphatidylethanolamine-binding protein [Secundilactobacillus pentosiphilus]|uniref:Phosphatidylethanolamine-binding protein n=2 Tax=Secundilactobacillus pentosiphilus TaxID=1714682 RepID=A0A1Z5IY56_9LACO|nr:phosphatidylethanolamine-binding protein [Secundilactobacillus pentosiphilus]
MMQIKVPVQNGLLPDIYGKYAPEKYRINNGPVRSFPIEIKDTPAGTKTYAITMIDHDAIPVSGFTWIHWVAANLPGDLTTIPENASQSGEVAMTFGNNSSAGRLVHSQDQQTSQHYTGPVPPDKNHRYTVTVYALDDKLPLEDGFWLNELHDAMKGHVLAEATQVVLSRA